MSEIKPVYLDIPRYCENCEVLSRSLAEAVREYERLREAIKEWVFWDQVEADAAEYGRPVFEEDREHSRRTLMALYEIAREGE